MKAKTIIALLFCLPLFSWGSEVWYTSNVATPDLPEMFSQPQEWAQSRPLINVLKLYQQQLTSDSVEQCPICEGNLFPIFRSHGMFEKLKDWGIQLAIEGGSVKPWDCDATINTRSVINLIDKLKGDGIRLYGIAMDEPFSADKRPCANQSEATTAYYVERYVNAIQDHNSKVWPGMELKIGLIEAYPKFRGNEIQRFVQLAIEAGYRPAFVHLDIDRNYLRSLKISDSKFKQKIVLLRTYLDKYNIPLGIIFWGQDGADKVKNAETLIDFAKKVKSLLGPPAHIGIQHWVETNDKRKIVPDNLNENEAYTGTNLTLQTLEILGASR